MLINNLYFTFCECAVHWDSKQGKLVKRNKLHNRKFETKVSKKNVIKWTVFPENFQEYFYETWQEEESTWTVLPQKWEKKQSTKYFEACQL